MRLFFLVIDIVAFFLGMLFWSGGLGFNDLVISSYGAVLFMVALCALMIYCLCVNGGNKVWSVINGTLIFVAIFCSACFFDLIPFMPSSEVAGTVYGMLMLPFWLAGGGSSTAEIVIIIKFL